MLADLWSASIELLGTIYILIYKLNISEVSQDVPVYRFQIHYSYQNSSNYLEATLLLSMFILS